MFFGSSVYADLPTNFTVTKGKSASVVIVKKILLSSPPKMLTAAGLVLMMVIILNDVPFIMMNFML